MLFSAFLWAISVDFKIVLGVVLARVLGQSKKCLFYWFPDV